MERRKAFNAFQMAGEFGPYDEIPMLPASIDPQIHLSRNDRPQPFFLICERDTTIAQLSGEAVIEFKDSSVIRHTVSPGDWVYVPAGTPHRIIPRTESIEVRYKAREPGLEGVAFHCEKCGAELVREEWDTAVELPQEGYLRSCQSFNDNEQRRVCARCGAKADPIDLSAFRWGEIARTLRADHGKES